MPVSGLPHLLEHTCFLLERSPGVIPRATCLLQPGPCLQTVTLESPGESQPPPPPPPMQSHWPLPCFSPKHWTQLACVPGWYLLRPEWGLQEDAGPAWFPAGPPSPWPVAGVHARHLVRHCPVDKGMDAEWWGAPRALRKGRVFSGSVKSSTSRSHFREVKRDEHDFGDSSSLTSYLFLCLSLSLMYTHTLQSPENGRAQPSIQ